MAWPESDGALAHIIRAAEQVEKAYSELIVGPASAAGGTNSLGAVLLLHAL